MNLVWFWISFLLASISTLRSVPQSKAYYTHPSSSLINTSRQMRFVSVKMWFCTDHLHHPCHKPSQHLWGLSVLKPWKDLWVSMTTLTLFSNYSQESRTQFSSKHLYHLTSLIKSWQNLRNVRVSQPTWHRRVSTLPSLEWHLTHHLPLKWSKTKWLICCCSWHSDSSRTSKPGSNAKSRTWKWE